MSREPLLATATQLKKDIFDCKQSFQDLWTKFKDLEDLKYMKNISEEKASMISKSLNSQWHDLYHAHKDLVVKLKSVEDDIKIYRRNLNTANRGISHE